MNKWKFDYQKRAIILITAQPVKATSFSSIVDAYENPITDKRYHRIIGYKIDKKRILNRKETMIIFNFDDSNLVINLDYEDNEIVTDRGLYNVDIKVINNRKTIITFANDYENYKFILINQRYLVLPQYEEEIKEKGLIVKEIIV